MYGGGGLQRLTGLLGDAGRNEHGRTEAPDPIALAYTPISLLTTNTPAQKIHYRQFLNASRNTGFHETHSCDLNTTRMQDSKAGDHLEKAVAKDGLSGVPRFLERRTRIKGER